MQIISVYLYEISINLVLICNFNDTFLIFANAKVEYEIKAEHYRHLIALRKTFL